MTAAAVAEPARPEPLRLPDPALLFEGRAVRLGKLAVGASAEEFLLLLSRVARGQALAVREVAARPSRAGGADGGGPPLAARRVARDETWRRMLGVILSFAKGPGLPAQAAEAIARLAGAGAEELETIAGEILAGEVASGDVACAPFVGAALQAWFAALADRLDPAAVSPGDPAACPVCGSPPVAGVVQGKDRLRYLSCSLCGAEWSFSRVHCVVCGKDDDLAYYGVESEPGAKAEACGRCRAYVKLFYEDERAGVEPAADDVATLALDLALAGEGWGRVGQNAYLATAAASVRE